MAKRIIENQKMAKRTTMGSIFDYNAGIIQFDCPDAVDSVHL